MRVLLVSRTIGGLPRTLPLRSNAAGYVVETVRDGEEAWFRGDTEDYGRDHP